MNTLDSNIEKLINELGKTAVIKANKNTVKDTLLVSSFFFAKKLIPNINKTYKTTPISA